MFFKNYSILKYTYILFYFILFYCILFYILEDRDWFLKIFFDFNYFTAILVKKF